MVWWLQRPGCFFSSWLVFCIVFVQFLIFSTLDLDGSGISGISITDPDNEELELGKVRFVEVKFWRKDWMSTEIGSIPSKCCLKVFLFLIFSRVFLKKNCYKRSFPNFCSRELWNLFRSGSITTVEHTNFASGKWERRRKWLRFWQFFGFQKYFGRWWGNLPKICYFCLAVGWDLVVFWGVPVKENQLHLNWSLPCLV